MKAYIDADGKIRMFRPDKNMERLRKSAARIQLPVSAPSPAPPLFANVVHCNDTDCVILTTGTRQQTRTSMATSSLNASSNCFVSTSRGFPTSAAIRCTFAQQ
jgi:hypothetical protein